MKATIDEEGLLSIQPETGLECYALRMHRETSGPIECLTHLAPEKLWATCHKCTMKGSPDNIIKGDDNRRDGNGYCRKCRGIS